MRAHDAAGAARRVLVVEDNLDTVQSLVLLLRDMGHRVEFAINGCTALEIARRFQPEIVFLDIGLPGLDGFEVCHRLRQEAGFEATRFVAITAYAEDEHRLRSRAAGCQLHLVKPVDPRFLVSLLDAP